MTIKSKTHMIWGPMRLKDSKQPSNHSPFVRFSARSSSATSPAADVSRSSFSEVNSVNRTCPGGGGD